MNTTSKSEETIFHATAATSLGDILVAMSTRGICLLEFLDSRSVETALRRRVPRARLQRSGKEQAGWVSALVARVDGTADKSVAGKELPLDIRGTAFQRRIWRALMAIPASETRSYGALARASGHPLAARAIGAACAANPLAVVIPCHRVVGAKGALTGYRWGVARKRELLRREAEGRGGEPLGKRHNKEAVSFKKSPAEIDSVIRQEM